MLPDLNQLESAASAAAAAAAGAPRDAELMLAAAAATYALAAAATPVGSLEAAWRHAEGALRACDAAGAAPALRARAAAAAVDVAEARCVAGAANANNFAASAMAGRGGASESAIHARLALHAPELDRAYAGCLRALLGAPAAATLAAAVRAAPRVPARGDALPLLARAVQLRVDRCKLAFLGAAPGGGAGDDAALRAEERDLAELADAVAALLAPGGATQPAAAAAAAALPAPQRLLLQLSCEAGLAWSWSFFTASRAAELAAILAVVCPASPVAAAAAALLDGARASAPPASAGRDAQAIQSRQFAALSDAAARATRAVAVLTTGAGPVPFTALAAASLQLATSRVAPNSDRRAEWALAASNSLEMFLKSLRVESSGGAQVPPLPPLAGSARLSSLQQDTLANAVPTILGSMSVFALSIGDWLPSAVAPQLHVGSESAAVLAASPRGPQLSLPGAIAASPYLARVVLQLALAQEQAGELVAAAASASGAASMIAALASQGPAAQRGAATAPNLGLSRPLHVLRTTAACVRARCLASQLNESLFRGIASPGLLLHPQALAVVGPGSAAAASAQVACTTARVFLTSATAGGGGGANDPAAAALGAARAALLVGEGLLQLRTGRGASACAPLKAASDELVALRSLPLAPDYAAALLQSARASDGGEQLSPYSPVASAGLADDGAVALALAAYGAALFYQPALPPSAPAPAPESQAVSPTTSLLAAAARDPGLARAWALLGSVFACPASSAVSQSAGAELVWIEKAPASLPAPAPEPSSPGVGAARDAAKALSCLTKAVDLRPDEPVGAPLLVDLLVDTWRATRGAAPAQTGAAAGASGRARAIVDNALARDSGALWALWRQGALACTTAERIMSVSSRLAAAAATEEEALAAETGATSALKQRSPRVEVAAKLAEACLLGT